MHVRMEPVESVLQSQLQSIVEPELLAQYHVFQRAEKEKKFHEIEICLKIISAYGFFFVRVFESNRKIQ